MLKNKIDRQYLIADTEKFYHRFFNNRSHVNTAAREFCSITSDAQRAAVIGYSEYYGYLRRCSDVVAGEYLDADTWDAQLLAKEAGTDAGSNDSLANVMNVSKSDYDYLFQDSTEPHMFTHCMNRIGKKTQIPPYRGFTTMEVSQ